MHNKLLQSGIQYDQEAEVSQFLTGLDEKRHPTIGLSSLDFQDLRHLGIPSSYTLENVITHLRSQEGKRLQNAIVRGRSTQHESGDEPETVLTSTSQRFSGQKRKKPESKDRSIRCSWCLYSGHKEKECRKKAKGEPHKLPNSRAGTSSAARMGPPCSRASGLCGIATRKATCETTVRRERGTWMLLM